MSDGGGAGEWTLFPPSATLSVARSESLAVKPVVLPLSTARRENRRGEWRATEAMDGVGVGRRVFWSFVFSGDASASSVDLRVKSPNTMTWREV